MATDYGKRLKAAMGYADLTQKELVEKTGLSQSTVSSAINRGNGSAYTSIFAKACNVNPHWLSTGEGRMETLTDEVLVIDESIRITLAHVSRLLHSIPTSSRDAAAYAAVQALIAHLPMMERQPTLPPPKDV